MDKVKNEYADWVAVDWGTSNLRYWLMSADKVIKAGSMPFGMNKLDRCSYEKIIIKELGDFLDPSKITTILICGMAGSRQGWKEAPYISVPCKPPEFWEAINVQCKDSRIEVKILPGLRQDRPVDIMRGEETQIKGVLNKYKNFDGIICLPGTHTKWARISAGEIVSFQTFMTGEMFYLLSEESVLKHSAAKNGLDEKIFKNCVNQMMSDNKLLSSTLFSLRAEFILKNLSELEARSRLSGYLIGLELSGSRAYWLGETVFILGEAEISLAYEIGLESQGVNVMRDLNWQPSLDGLKAVFNNQKKK